MNQVFIPWRAQPSREEAFNFCRNYWESHGFTVVTVDTGNDPFPLAESRNRAVALAEGPAVVADADTIADITTIFEAINIAVAEQRTVLPYTEYRMLQSHGTIQALHGYPLEECHHQVYAPAASGIYVTTPTAWNAYGGQDPRFRGWLGEDMAHLVAHRTLVGPLRRVEGRAYALSHYPAQRSGPQYEANLTLMNRYIEADGNPEAIRALIGER